MSRPLRHRPGVAALRSPSTKTDTDGAAPARPPPTAEGDAEDGLTHRVETEPAREGWTGPVHRIAYRC